MKWITVISLVLVIILYNSCSSSKKSAHNKDKTDEVCEAMTYNSKPVNNIATDYYTIDSLFIIDNCLNIWASFSGGCGAFEFKLLYNDRVMESMPPKTNLLLQLTDNDPCRAIVQQKLFFNLSFFDEYANQDGILLKLVGTDKSVLYKR